MAALTVRSGVVVARVFLPNSSLGKSSLLLSGSLRFLGFSDGVLPVLVARLESQVITYDQPVRNFTVLHPRFLRDVL